MPASSFFRPRVASLVSPRAGLEQILQRYLATTQPRLKDQVLAELSIVMTHPRQLLETALLTESHPLRRQALAVCDAFEAVTNGMIHPGVMEALEQIDDRSLFGPWKHLLLAIYFFYQDLFEASRQHLGRIAPESIPSRVTSAFGWLLDEPTNTPVPAAVERLWHEIFEPDPVWQQALGQLSDALDAGLEGPFWAALELVLDLLKNDDDQKSLVLWAWNQLAWGNFDDQRLMELSRSLWGASQAFRLASLGTVGWDPEGALLLWGRYMLSCGAEGHLEPPLWNQAWGLFAGFVDAVWDFQQSQGEVDGWDADWRSFARMWNHERELLHFPAPALAETWGPKSLQKPQAVTTGNPLHPSGSPEAREPLRPRKAKASWPESAGQLELFFGDQA